MRIPSDRTNVIAEGRRRGDARGEGAFTLLEIAVALGVVAFALVAVLGTLPAGLTTQKDNREKAVINEDARLLIEAMREGEETLFSLTNHVEAILRIGTNVGAPEVFVTNVIIPNVSTSPVLMGEELGTGATFPAGAVVAPLGTNNAAMILATLTTPRGTPMNAKGSEYLYKTVALVRSFSGGMLEQGMAVTSDLSFRYLLTVEVSSFSGFYSFTDVERNLPGLTLGGELQASNRLQQVTVLSNNVHELRLTFQWPVVGGRAGSNRQTYRTLISGVQQQVLYPSTPLAEEGQLYRFQSQVYQGQASPPIR